MKENFFCAPCAIFIQPMVVGSYSHTRPRLFEEGLSPPVGQQHLGNLEPVFPCGVVQWRVLYLVARIHVGPN